MTSGEFDRAVGAYMRAAREGAGLSQRDLAAKIGMAQSLISRWENGAYSPTLATVRKVADACDRELYWEFIGRERPF